MKGIEALNNISDEEKIELLDTLDKIPSCVSVGDSYDRHTYVLNLRKFGNKWFVSYVNEYGSYFEDVWFENSNLCYALREMSNFLKR